MRVFVATTLLSFLMLVELLSAFKILNSGGKRCKSFLTRNRRMRIELSATSNNELAFAMNKPFDIDNVEIVKMTTEMRESQKFYGTALSNSPVLVLNADYKPLSLLPLSVWHWQDAVRAIFSNKAIVVSEYKNIMIRSVSYQLRLPSVIALKHYQKTPSEGVPTMTRRKVFLRDNFKCQVCKS